MKKYRSIFVVGFCFIFMWGLAGISAAESEVNNNHDKIMELYDNFKTSIMELYDNFKASDNSFYQFKKDQPLFQNNDMQYNIQKTSPSSSSAEDAEGMDYEEVMNYLLEGKTPSYIVVNGDISKLEDCTFTATENKPKNHDLLSNHYKDKPLDDEKWKGTLVYVPNNYKLKTHFITSSESTIGLIEYSSFMRDIRNTQYAEMYPITIPKPPEAKEYSLDTNKALAETDKIMVELETTLNTYQTEADKVYYNNLVVAQARGDTSKRYWGCGYHPKFANIDDNGLEIMNIAYGNAKTSLTKPIEAHRTTEMAIEASILALKPIEISTPSDFGMDKAIKFTIYGLDLTRYAVKCGRVYLGFKQADFSDMTTDISSEKSYRALIRNGAAVPEWNEKTINEYNKLVDNQIANLTKLIESEHDRIFTPTIESIRENAIEQMNYYGNIKYWLEKTKNTKGGTNSTYAIVSDAYTEYQDVEKKVDETMKMLEIEKKLYPYFVKEINRIKLALEKTKQSPISQAQFQENDTKPKNDIVNMNSLLIEVTA